MANCTGEVEVLCGEEHAAPARSEGDNSLAQHDHSLRIERRGRLIDENERGRQRERRDGARLATKPARERGEPLIEATPEPKGCRKQARPSRRLRPRSPERMRQGDQLGNAELVEAGRIVRYECCCPTCRPRPRRSAGHDDRDRKSVV